MSRRKYKIYMEFYPDFYPEFYQNFIRHNQVILHKESYHSDKSCIRGYVLY